MFELPRDLCLLDEAHLLLQRDVGLDAGRIETAGTAVDLGLRDAALRRLRG